MKSTEDKIEDALRGDDPLSYLDLIVEESNSIQELFHFLYSAVLQVNSAGISMLFDRFGKEEIDLFTEKFEELGAAQFSEDLRTIRNRILSNFEVWPKEDDLIDFTSEEEFEDFTRPFDLKFREHCGEMEKVLLAFVKVNLTELKECKV